jgi:enoyl-CoA hydratase/carnithine racemase
VSLDPTTLEPEHFLWDFAEGVATIRLNRPERKNPLTFDSYAELRDTFRELCHTPAVKVVVITGAGGNFCSGGDVHEIIGPLTKMDESGLLDFTRMTGDLVRAVRACPQPIVAAVEGVCAGAGAILAMASDLRIASPNAKTAFLFTRVGLSGADMGAEEGLAWGFWNRLSGNPLADAQELARDLARGPTLAHAATKRQLDAEWHVPIETALDMEAEAQARLMQTRDFHRAYEAFAAKRTPEFQGD